MYLHLAPITLWSEVLMQVQNKKCTAVISTSSALLKKLTYLENNNPSLDNYAGSLFVRDGIEVLFIDPLKQLITVPYGKFLTKHFISKLLSPTSWIDVQLDLSNSFSFSMVEPSNAEYFLSVLEGAFVCAVDIETFKNPLAIRCVGFTAITESAGRYSSTSFVLVLDSDFALSWLRKFVASPVEKIFQNGKYDLSYLAMYDAPVYNWMWDTATMFHCTYSELPKDLGFLQAFHVRNAQYWKDMAETHDLHEYYKYCALDTWGTAVAFLGMLWKLQDYAKVNYLLEFPVNFPAHMCEMRGLLQDQDVRKSQEKKYTEIIEKETASLQRMLDAPGFNTNSPQQVKKLLTILGCSDIESTEEQDLKKAMVRHPLNELLLNKILDIRGYRKLTSTYLGDKTHKGRVLYALNPHGTDTARLASRAHHFWCGLQVQNIPRDDSVKCTIVADPGFELYECDLEQAESRDTAFAAGEPALIAAVTSVQDFHSTNAAAFFGRPYNTIYSDEKKKAIDKPLRDLAKRVNHGANYLMGPDVLVDTMGLKNVWVAAKALALPKFWTPKQIAEDLLARFHRTYPQLSAIFYPAVVDEVVTTHKLTSRAQHFCDYQATTSGWTRYCFKDPKKNKRDKNAYVAHVAQSLNAITLNKAFLNVFFKIALPNPQDFKLCAQIHDSILFQVRIGRKDLANQVKELMEIPVRIKSYDGVTRDFVVPAALKGPAQNWSKTE